MFNSRSDVISTLQKVYLDWFLGVYIPIYPRRYVAAARLSVTLKYRDHIGWSSAKIISRLISLTISLSADPNMTDLLQRGTLSNFSRNRSGYRENVDFRHLSRRISETVQDRVQVAIDH